MYNFILKFQQYYYWHPFCKIFVFESSFTADAICTFRFSLIIAPRNFTARQIMTLASDETAIYKVLIADDDSAVRHAVVAILSSLKHFCHVASDGADALGKAKREHFDAVVTDIHMPHMDGITLTRELLKFNPSIPVMVMTGQSDPLTAGNAMANGASVFISKPFTAQEFLSAFMAMMLNHKDSTQKKQYYPGGIGTDILSEPHWDISK